MSTIVQSLDGQIDRTDELGISRAAERKHSYGSFKSVPHDTQRAEAEIMADEADVKVIDQRLKKSLLQLYFAEAFSQFGDQMWSFSLALFLLQLWPSSLRVPAVYIFFTQLCAFLFCPIVGRWIDRTNRIRAASVCLTLQNLSVVTTCILLIICFSTTDLHASHAEPTLLLYILTASVIAVAAVGMLYSTSMIIIIEQDWLIVLCRNNVELLAQANANLRRIGLLCRLFGPIAIGGIMSLFSDARWSLAVVAGWNALSLILELSMLTIIYNRLPELRVSRTVTGSSNKELHVEGTANSVDNSETALLPISTSVAVKSTDDDAGFATKKKKKLNFFQQIYGSWHDYFTQSIAPAGIALALLYCTVLGFDGITNSYIVAQGMSPSTTSVAMALGSLFGFIGTLLYPSMRRVLGLERTGLFSFAFQFSLLLLFCCVSVVLPGSPFYLYKQHQSDTFFSRFNFIFRDFKYAEFVSIGTFLFGLVVSRAGLWISDICVTQLFQQHVANDKRGSVNGVQASLNQVCDMIKNVLVIVLPNVDTFGWLIFISCAAVGMAYCSFAYYSFRVRKHLLPFHPKG